MVIVVGVLAAQLSGCMLKQELVIATDATFYPFEYIDEQNRIVGFDIDIAEYIAKELNRKLVIENMPFRALTGALNARQVDLVISGMTITEDRKARANFSVPYYNASQVIVIRADETRNISTPEDLADLNIAVQMGTTGAFEAEAIKGDEYDPSIKQFELVKATFQAVMEHKADAIIVDQLVAEHYLQLMGGLKIIGEPFTNEQFGIAVRKDDPGLLESINKALRKLKESGEYNRMFAKWFDVSK